MTMLLEVEAMAFSRGADDQRFTVEIPSLTLHAGELVAVTGRSGSGKSTVLELLGLLSQPHAMGHFLWHGQGHAVDLARLWSRRAHGELAQIRGAAMGFVLQTHGLLPFLTVAGNLALIRRSLGLPQRDAQLDAMIERLEIGAKLHKKPHELSVGEQQRASIVRALAHRPALVLADEPTSALDPGLGDRVMELLLEQAKAHGIAILIATHEVERVEQLGLRRVCGSDQRPANGFAWRFAG
ncbi:ATP-binding cassette domain-containing protein [uncultured Thiodictyon sp.]|uniref:ABC transporter ATP-binding protein n=1 Tax=uncultured Thiodictyon sp. TaxID=1846217 RepID=UPI0025DE4BDC|nr:ATP-binding cassette domain-containing protein [uncultured Thiodictyon sp.]